MKLACEEEAQSRAELRISAFIKLNISRSAEYILKTGDEVSAYSGEEKN